MVRRDDGVRITGDSHLVNQLSVNGTRDATSERARVKCVCQRVSREHALRSEVGTGGGPTYQPAIVAFAVQHDEELQHYITARCHRSQPAEDEGGLRR
ncbi:hypothetical protein EYF80_007998 [Liparis tanakae]|uniref:Uncharacterized protein n=1 Tax=Liparis tanakae TaxID=230148 RepID=A0A4Z2IV41_9TELE|nr:hypothetical protein EYF80_007998 [Liparis tanakae]